MKLPAMAAAGLVLAAWAPARAQADAGGQSPDGAAAFDRCAACHLVTGEGVPGTYPPLRIQVPRLARQRPGREYMVTAVSHGLTGALTIDGTTYNAFMPAQNLSDAELAAALNYILTHVAKPRSWASPFSPGEVGWLRARHPIASAQDSRALRPEGLAGGSK